MIDHSRFAPWVSHAAQDQFRGEVDMVPPPTGDVAAMRAHYDAFNRRFLAGALAAYPVDIVEQDIAGVRVHVVTPLHVEVPAHRILICLHGGAFMWGRGAGALLEAVPVAATAGMRVIAVEYALAPERAFPAATDDVLAVYRDLLERQPAAGIGIYGCSAGGILTAQVTARLLADGIAVPGAVAMLCGAGLEMHGDSMMTAAALTGQSESPDAPSLAALPYFASADPADPLVFPGEHPKVLAGFPPSLLVTGTRDFAASSVSVMHRRLIAAGADSRLLHFDGMWHAFHMATTLPEARETFTAMARFFDRHLA